MQPHTAERGRLLADLRRLPAETEAAGANQLEVPSATATGAQLEVGMALLGRMLQTQRKLLELPSVEDTPKGTNLREQALGQVTRAAVAERELAAAKATCVHDNQLRREAADLLVERARAAAEAAAEVAAGRPARAAPPKGQAPACSA